MKNLKIIFSILTFVVSFSAHSWLSQYVGIKGIVRGYNKKEVEIEDMLRARVFIPREAVPANYKFETGKIVSIPVDVQKFSQIRSVPNNSVKRLHNQSELAFANLQKDLAYIKK